MQEIPPSHKTNNFDFLRLAAAIMVLYGHCFLLTGNLKNEPLGMVTKWHIEEIGVYIFFLISGYLISRSYKSNSGQYIKNRCLRIFPALLVNSLLTVFI